MNSDIPYLALYTVNVFFKVYLKRRILAFIKIIVMASLLLSINSAFAETANDINKDASQALANLYKSNKVADELSKRAVAVLVFPNIIKAGLIFDGSYGEGVLIKKGEYIGYYNSVGGPWGPQAGAQSYSYAILLMTDKAAKYLEDSRGWEIGVGPTMVVINEGAAKNLSSSTFKDDTYAYAFIFDQQSFMLEVSIEGTKISQINR